jgi:hypothetical protein
MAIKFPMLTYLTREDWLDRAKRSVREAERWEAQTDGGDDRSPLRRMRDELLLAQAEASIAIAEALTADKQPHPDQPAQEEPREADGPMLEADLGEIDCTPSVPHFEIHIQVPGGPIASAPAITGAARAFRP